MASMSTIVESRVAECNAQAAKYDLWLKWLRVPNIILNGGGSLLAFLGGAAILAERWKGYAGYMALAGGALTGAHGWFGCETHQQKCRTIAATYVAFSLKYGNLMVDMLTDDEKQRKFSAIEDSYIEFVAKMDAKPWI